MSGRAIVREIRSSESFTALTYRQRDLWQGLIEVADDQGRLPGTAALVRSAVWPADDISLSDVQSDLDVLAGCADPFIVVYQVDGKTYIQIINWWRYQKMNWAQASAYPAPTGWLDRVRVNAQGNKITSLNWESEGGFEKRSAAGTQVDDEVDSGVDTQPDTQVIKLNKTKDKPNKEKDKASCAATNPTILSPDTGEDLLVAWNLALGNLQAQMSKAEFDSWVKPTRPLDFDNGIFRVSTMNNYAASWLNSHVAQTMARLLRPYFDREVQVRFEVREPALINTS